MIFVLSIHIFFIQPALSLFLSLLIKIIHNENGQCLLSVPNFHIISVFQFTPFAIHISCLSVLFTLVRWLIRKVLQALPMFPHPGVIGLLPEMVRKPVLSGVFVGIIWGRCTWDAMQRNNNMSTISWSMIRMSQFLMMYQESVAPISAGMIRNLPIPFPNS